MSRFLSCWATAAVLALATVLVSSSASAGLCANCTGKAFIANVGKCSACGAATASGAFKLCPACSTARNQCQACLAPLSVVITVAPPVVVPGTETKPVVPPVVTAVTETKSVAPPVVTAATEAKPVVTPVVTATTETKPVGTPAAPGGGIRPPPGLYPGASLAPAAPAAK